jgi:hexosaminidase
VPGLTEADILGVEAPIRTETLESIVQVEEFAFPRLAAIAELGWSPAGVGVDDFLSRVPALGRVWDATGTRYWRTPEVDWR